MRVTLAVTAWTVSVLSSYSHPADGLPDINNETFIKDCVQIHNKFRSEVKPRASDMLYMTWDPVLAQVAKAWARNCKFQHNIQLQQPHKLHPNFTSLGENIWTGSLSIFSVSSAIESWYSEIQYYDFKTRKCNKVCGHYTQAPGIPLYVKTSYIICGAQCKMKMWSPLFENKGKVPLKVLTCDSIELNQVVWAESYKVGCAVHFCPQVSGVGFRNAAHFICNYGPPGNYPTWPYKRGSTCSACPQNDMCLDNLCDSVDRFNKYPWRPNQDGSAKCAGHSEANPQRDKVTRYYSIVYPDWPLSQQNRHLSLFLIVSPPILILSAIITILVKNKYLI